MKVALHEVERKDEISDCVHAAGVPALPTLTVSNTQVYSSIQN